MKNKLVIAFTAICIFSSASVFADASIKDGKTIFTTQCTSCHNVNAQVVGPALANVDQRHTVDWIINFVRSPKTFIEKKDKDAIALYNKFNQIIMPDHQDLSADDVQNVLAYIKSETKTETAQTAPFAKPGELVPNYHPLTIENNYSFFLLYLFLVFVFVLLLVVAVNVKEIQRNHFDS